MMETKVSMNAALHQLGQALGKLDDRESEDETQDQMGAPGARPGTSDAKEESKIYVISEAATIASFTYAGLTPRPTKLTNKTLKEALSKPFAKQICKNNKIDGRRGRTAYKLEIYQQKTRVKINDLQSRMDAIGDRRDTQWLRLRKQLLALKDRLAKREHVQEFE